MLSADFGKTGERKVRCPSCGKLFKVKNWHAFGKTLGYFNCPNPACQATLTKREFLALGDGVFAYARPKNEEKVAKECPCKACELDCNANIGTVNCPLDKGDG